MKKIATILFLFLLCSGLAAQSTIPIPKSLLAGTKPSQKAPDTTNRNIRFVVGGYVGFQVSNNLLDLQVSPHVGILPGIDFLCVGIGGTYQLTYYKDIYGRKSFQHIFGGNFFVEGYIWQKLVIHAEYELLSFPSQYVFTTTPLFMGANERPAAHGILAGPGYKQDVGNNLSFYTLVLFSIYDPQNVRGIVDVRVGVNYKF